MRLSELKKAGRTPSLPLTIELADAAGPGQLQLLSLLRVLPGERYVGAGVWRGRTVLAKLLVGSKAARHFQRELGGVRLLAQQGRHPVLRPRLDDRSQGAQDPCKRHQSRRCADGRLQHQPRHERRSSRSVRPADVGQHPLGARRHAGRGCQIHGLSGV